MPTSEPPLVTALRPVLAALVQHGRELRAAALADLTRINTALERSRRMSSLDNLTAAITVTGLAAQVAAVERYGPSFPGWVITSGAPAGSWVLRWDRTALRVDDVSSLRLAQFIASERTLARRQLRRDVMAVVDELGLTPRGRFLQPAELVVNAGLTRCPGCSCNVRATEHRPGSPECDEDRRERLISISS